MDSQGLFEGMSERYVAETLDATGTTRSLHRRVRTQAVLDLIARYARPGATVADVGCGPAQLAQPLVARGFRYVGIDPVAEMFRSSKEALASVSQASFIVGEAEKVPLGDGSVDVVAVIGVIEYLRTDAWLREAGRILRPPGIVVVSFPNLVNPVQGLRALTRPVAGPLIRMAAPRSAGARTAYASQVFHRPFLPWGRLARFRAEGYRIAEVVYQSFCMHVGSRRLADGEAQAHFRREARGARWFPWLGAEVICALERG